MKKSKKVFVIFFISFVIYTAFSLLTDTALATAPDFAKTAGYSALMAAIMVAVFTYGVPRKEIIAFVPASAIRKGLNPADIDALISCLLGQIEDLQKAECITVAGGLEFRFSKPFGWHRYTVRVTTRKSGLRIEGKDTSPVLRADDTPVRIQVHKMQTVLAEKAA